MTDIYTQALTEVDEILNYVDEELFKKIPNKFISFVKRMKDKNYKFEYNVELPLEEQELKPETKAILSLMYRKYWCSEEERKRLEQEDIQELRRIEKEKQEKYNVDNMFKTTKQQPEPEPQMSITVIEEKENIITRIFNAIKNFFTGK